MKIPCAFIWSCFWLLVGLGQLCAQEKAKDVVYLTNGSIVKGNITEAVPDSLIKLQTADGTLLVFRAAEIIKTEKELPSGEIPGQELPHGPGSTFSFIGGAAIPVGAFADESGGAATLGFCAGVQFQTTGTFGFLMDARYVYSPVDKEKANKIGGGGSASVGNWGSIQVLLGPRLGTSGESHVKACVAPLLGIHIGMSPSMEYDRTVIAGGFNRTSRVHVNVESATGVALAYGGIAQVSFDHFMIGVLFSLSNPNYEITASTPGSSSVSDNSTISTEQITGMVQLNFGIEL